MHVAFDFAFSDFCVVLKNKIILKLEATYVLVLEMISWGKFGETIDYPPGAQWGGEESTCSREVVGEVGGGTLTEASMFQAFWAVIYIENRVSFSWQPYELLLFPCYS